MNYRQRMWQMDLCALCLIFFLCFNFSSAFFPKINSEKKYFHSNYRVKCVKIVKFKNRVKSQCKKSIAFNSYFLENFLNFQKFLENLGNFLIFLDFLKFSGMFIHEVNENTFKNSRKIFENPRKFENSTNFLDDFWKIFKRFYTFLHSICI